MRGFGVYELGKAGPMEKPDPKIVNSTDVIVKTTCVAPCTSDNHLIYMSFVPGIFGNFIGHEAVGVVSEVGEDVKDFKVGDRVCCPSSTPKFGSMLGQAGAWGQAGGRTADPDSQGMFAEYIYYKNGDQYLAHIPDNVTDEQAVMVTDMMGTAICGLKELHIQYGETVAIIGIGPVGLMGVAGAVLNGAGKIIAVGHRSACVKLAYEYGATTVIDYKDTDDVVKAVIAANGGKPVDKVLICGGTPDTVLDAHKMARPGSIIIKVAMLIDENGQMPKYYPVQAGGGDKTYRSVQVYGGRLLVEQMLALISNGRVDPGKMVSHVFHGVDEIGKAFEVMGNKTDDLVKPIIMMDK